MKNKYTEVQIQDVLERLKKKDPKGATKERAIKILDTVTNTGMSDIMSALNKVSKAKTGKKSN